jgi:antiviral helicase SKI2
MQHDEWLLTEKIAGLQKQMSDQNLQLLPDYEQRISVLKDLGFIDENERVELKGKVACEVWILIAVQIHAMYLRKSDPLC